MTDACCATLASKILAISASSASTASPVVCRVHDVAIVFTLKCFVELRAAKETGLMSKLEYAHAWASNGIEIGGSVKWSGVASSVDGPKA